MARKDLVARIGRLAKAVAITDRKGDDAGVEKWSIRLADASTTLAVMVNPELAEEEEELSPAAPVFTPPPAALPSNRISSKIYGPWGLSWFQASFPEAYADYPPVIALIDPDRIAAKAKAEGVLAEVCAAGLLAVPEGFWDDKGDWSLFTGLVTVTGDVPSAKVWIMGKCVARSDVVDDRVFDWAADNGLDLN